MEKWQNPQTIATWLAIGLLFALVLVTFIVLLLRASHKRAIARQIADSSTKMKHQEELLSTSIRIQEYERERIAGDLHDDLINKLYAHKLSLEKTENQETIDSCIDTARRISHDLSPPLLELTDLPELIEELLFPWQKTHQISFIEDIRPHTIEISKDIKLQLIRTLGELINNIKKHAQAAKIDLRLRITKQSVCILLSDNGIGFNPDKVKNGLGLKSMESRIQIINGGIKLKSTPNFGTRAIIKFQLTN